MVEEGRKGTGRKKKEYEEKREMREDAEFLFIIHLCVSVCACVCVCVHTLAHLNLLLITSHMSRLSGGLLTVEDYQAAEAF